MAGYSHGGRMAVEAWSNAALRRVIDELYLFDPQMDMSTKPPRTGLPNVGELMQWLDTNGRRRHFRLIGGSIQHANGLVLVNQLLPKWREQLERYEKNPASEPAPLAWCRPKAPEFWRGLGQFGYYAWAFWPQPNQQNKQNYLPKDTKTPPPAFDDASSSTRGELTKLTNIEIVRDDANTVIIRRVNARKTVTLHTVSKAELAGFAGVQWLVNMKRKAIADDDELDVFAKAAIDCLVFGDDPTAKTKKHDLGHGVRHQWAIAGGEDDATRGAQFKGYLYLCLRDSGFPA